MNHQRRTRTPQQEQNELLREENTIMLQQNIAMAEILSSPCRSCNETMIPTNLDGLKRQLRLENAQLRSEIETIHCFISKFPLYSFLFPSAASSWLYAAAVMTAQSLKEVASLAKRGAPTWIHKKLNLNKYYSKYFPWYARNAPGFVHEASKASSLLPCDASSLVTTLMDIERWPKIFPSIIGAATMESQHNGIQVINMEVMPLISPSIQTRDVKILRCSKQIENDTWVIADMSLYFSSYVPDLQPKFMRFPSGYLVKHIANRVCKVTVIDHWVYKEQEVINLDPNLGFGAQRWLSSLQRHCYNICLSYTPSIGHQIQIFDEKSRTNLLNLSGLMVYKFCTGFFGLTEQRWNHLLTVGFPANNFIRMFTQEGQDMLRGPCVSVSSTGLARMQAKPNTIFRLITHARKKDIWNYLQSVGDIQEMIRIRRSPDSRNETSVSTIERIGSNHWCMIQEMYYDESSAMIIHAFVKTPSLATALDIGNISDVELLPCGIIMMPYRQEECFVSVGCQGTTFKAMVTTSDELVIYLRKMVNDTLENVQNAHLVSSNLR